MIYFIQTNDNQHIKIGYAADIPKRMESLQTGSPIGVKLLGAQPGDHKLERALHDRFDSLRVRREWFHTSPRLVEYAITASALMQTGIADNDAFLVYAAREPRLIPLFVEAASTRDDGDPPYFCANEVFFCYHNPRAGLKWRLSRLVGHFADTLDPFLLTSQAYDVVYDRIYAALPDCRGRCMCVGGVA